MRVQGIILEDHTDPSALRGQIGDIVLAKINLTAGGPQQAADQIQAGGFTAARRAQQADQFAVRDLKGEIIDGNDLVRLVLASSRELLCKILQYNFHTSFPFLS